MKNSSRIKKILLAAAVLLLSAILVFLVIFFWHLPGHISEKRSIKIADNGSEIRVMSCNLRCLTPLDLGEKSWFNRSSLILEDIAAAAPDIVGFQEATKWQYGYMEDCLEGYDSVITYRDKSLLSEGCPIFYRSELYELVDKGSFWLSETPEKMSKDWGAACYRICSYVILAEKLSGERFVIFNTHLDHVSDEARIKGINVVLDKIAEFGGYPSVIMGDFNAEEGSETYKAATENFLDAACSLPEEDRRGTFQRWGEIEGGRRIDYFMISKTGFEIADYDVLSVNHGGVYASDHCPIVLELKLAQQDKKVKER
ncbi:MAG: endonuclease/exonuclease/phosphatase family protein [Ruminococcaceae bacterium]|nr:endonuclease/exonuclease/phosphatase family protein [Oscillospiraceae bacterium]